MNTTTDSAQAYYPLSESSGGCEGSMTPPSAVSRRHRCRSVDAGPRMEQAAWRPFIGGHHPSRLPGGRVV